MLAITSHALQRVLIALTWRKEQKMLGAYLKRFLIFLFITISFQPISLFAYDLTDSFSIEGTLTAVGQHAELDDVVDENGNNVSDTGRAAVVIDIGANYHPTQNDEFQLTYSFAEGEALNGLEAFSLAPFADDLEEDLSDINRSDRYNLLEAWYKHTFGFREQSSLGLSLGIIGATGYIDDNEYANDEVSQFMNDIFVNHPLANLPDHDVGAVMEFESGLWSVKAVVMDSENDDRNDYHYYAIQIGHHVTTRWGMGNYRIYGFTTTNEFIDREGTGKDNLTGFGVSIDQQISETVGIFARFGTQDDEVPVDHDKMASLGFAVAGTAWNRADDVVGVGIAFLDGAKSSGIDETKALEAYYKFVFSDYFDLSIDAQWIEDELRSAKDPKGTLIGLRFNANF